MVTPWDLSQGDHIANDKYALTEEHGEKSGQDSVLLELLLLEENKEALLAHEVAVAHSVELEVDNEGHPFDCQGCLIIGIGPLIESFVLNDLDLEKVFTLLNYLLGFKELL